MCATNSRAHARAAKTRTPLHVSDGTQETRAIPNGPAVWMNTEGGLSKGGPAVWMNTEGGLSKGGPIAECRAGAGGERRGAQPSQREDTKQEGLQLVTHQTVQRV